MVDRGLAGSCDSHPMVRTGPGPFGVDLSARILGPLDMFGWDIGVFAFGLGRNKGSPERLCSIRELDMIFAEEDLDETELWRCMNDMTRLCRDLGLPPIE